MAKILIVERMGDDVYVYTESLKQHARVQENPDNERRAENRVKFSVFENECNVRRVLEDGQWTSTVVME